ncbi:phage tail protein [Amycolatopsis sp. NPDC049252]|uniref:phage tail protein n=1 Tax=Amycolatopsis sp. NPDC049252 TaxID=3363933 RepID=UPI003710C5F3
MTIPHLVQAPLGVASALGSRASVPKPPGPSATPRYGMTMWFQVVVTSPTGQRNLGLWSGCSGLAVALETRELRSGGEYQAPYLYPEQISYPNVRLERAMEQTSSGQVRDWLEKVARDWIGSAEGGAAMVTAKPGDKPASSGFHGTTVTITLLTALAHDAKGATGSGAPQQERRVATWELQDAIPVHWQGPALTAKNGDIAIEQLTLAHRGFLKAERPTSGGAAGLNNQEQGKLRLSIPDSTAPDDLLVFQYSPATLTEELTVRGAEENSTLVVGTAKEGELVYNRKNITLSDLHIEGVEAVKETYDKLWKWTEPDIGSNKANPKAHKDKRVVQTLRLRLGSGTAGVVIDEDVTIKRVSFHYLRFTSAGVPSRAKLTLAVTVRTRGDLATTGASTPVV